MVQLGPIPVFSTKPNTSTIYRKMFTKKLPYKWPARTRSLFQPCGQDHDLYAQLSNNTIARN